ncbi:MAG: hypothetical protein IAF38_12360 [Bacteroidia bacterium]|nr:hypothetical protein [Bacteroidia bacterium]
MQKGIIKKQAEEKLQLLKDLLLTIDISAPATHQDVREIQKRLQEAERIITVYEYLLAQNEIAGDFSVHLKIMEKANSIESEQSLRNIETEEASKKKAEEIKEEKKVEPVKEIVPVVEKVITEEVKKPEQKVVELPKEPAPKQKTETKKLEISINDKYRMINELFHHSQQEFNIAIAQLNEVADWSDAKLYLDSLVSVYGWDEEKDIVKTLFKISLKRFS